MFQSIDYATSVKPFLKDFWNLETIKDIDNQTTKGDEMVKKHFKENLTFANKCYQVTWPWKGKNPELSVNQQLAVGQSNVSRMSNKPELLKQYDFIIQEHLEKCIMEKVENTYTNSIKYYLPCHAVIKTNKLTSKHRIVYDASSKAKKDYKSLNECLYRGHVMIIDQRCLLTRFRLHQKAMLADIEMPLLQIRLQSNQRNVTEFI